jgi:hypothetical protein
MDMGLAMTVVMIVMMVFMVGAMIWGAIAARGSRLWSANRAPKTARPRPGAERRAAGRRPG